MNRNTQSIPSMISFCKVLTNPGFTNIPFGRSYAVNQILDKSAGTAQQTGRQKEFPHRIVNLPLPKGAEDIAGSECFN